MNSGDTAWILMSTALVLFMTLPGLAMFYAGLVRSKSVLSVMMHCFSIAALVSVLWLVVGYSLSFGDSLGGIVGGFNRVFFAGMAADMMRGSIPAIVFAIFQMTFAIITPALIVGAYVERIKFSSMLILSSAWLILVYAPVCHWVWGGGWLGELGVMDFAGGLVVHTTAGVSALVIAALLGRRIGFPGKLQPPHNPGMTAAGAAMLWVGWFGFNGGSQLMADGGAGMAITATHLAAASAVIVWSAIEWIKLGKPSLVGAVTGAIAGLATVTPASGFVGPIGGVILGALAGIVCFFAVGIVKERLKIDDSLDVLQCTAWGHTRHAAGISLSGRCVWRWRSLGCQRHDCCTTGRTGTWRGCSHSMGGCPHFHYRESYRFAYWWDASFCRRRGARTRPRLHGERGYDI